MRHEFYFVTFAISFAIFLIQLILSTFSDKPSKYQFIEEDDVRAILYPVVLLTCNVYFTEPMS